MTLKTRETEPVQIFKNNTCVRFVCGLLVVRKHNIHVYILYTSNKSMKISYFPNYSMAWMVLTLHIPSHKGEKLIVLALLSHNGRCLQAFACFGIIYSFLGTPNLTSHKHQGYRGGILERQVSEHKFESSQTWVFVWFSTLIFPFYKMLFMNRLEFLVSRTFL